MVTTPAQRPESLERKTDYFGTFLDSLSRAPATVVADTLGTTAPSQAPPQADPGDRLDKIVALLGRYGTMSVKDLVLASGQSLDAVLASLEQLRVYELALVDGPLVRLTPDGAELARRHARPEAAA